MLRNVFRVWRYTATCTNGLKCGEEIAAFARASITEFRRLHILVTIIARFEILLHGMFVWSVRVDQLVVFQPLFCDQG